MSESRSRSSGGNRGNSKRNVRGRVGEPAHPTVPAIPSVPVPDVDQPLPPAPAVVPLPLLPAAALPLVRVLGYLEIPEFLPYPLNGDQTNVYQLFKKKLSHTDVSVNLQVTGKNLHNFHDDAMKLLSEGDDDQRQFMREYNVRLRLVRGDNLIADGDIKLRRQILGKQTFLGWRLFALEHDVPLNDMEGKQIYAWCEWVKVVGLDKHELRIIIKLPY